MRAFLLIILASVAWSLQLVAQRPSAPTHQSQRVLLGHRSMELDTLTSPTLFEPCSETVFILEPTGDEADGFVAGTNNFLDKEKAIFLRYSEGLPFSISGVVAYFFPPDDSAINQRELVAFISEVAADGSPGDLLAESIPIAIQDLNTAEGEVLPTIFAFSEPIDLDTEEFFVSIDFTDVYESPTGNIGLWMTEAGCAETPNPSWELWDDFSWHNIEDEDSWQEEREWLIGALVESLATSTVDLQTPGDLRIGPNPSAGQIIIEYQQEQPSHLRVEVLTSGSTTLKTYDLGRQAAGSARHQLDLSDLSSGLYFLRFVGDDWARVEPIVLE
ncbi:MAG: hypothetical protein AAFY36_15495 [Bacteroidota bacterium]